VIILIITIVIIVFLLAHNKKEGYFSTFESKSNSLYLIDTQNSYALKKVSSTILERFFTYSLDYIINKNNQLYKNDTTNLKIEEKFSEDKKIKLPGTVLSKCREYVIVESSPTNILMVIPGYREWKDNDFQVNTTATKIIAELVCCNEKTNEIFVYDKENGKLLKTLKSEKQILTPVTIIPHTISDSECIYYNGESLINVLDETKKIDINLADTKNAFLFRARGFENYLLYDGNIAKYITFENTLP
jgi:preprotein translocase subunit SecG